MGGKDKNQVGNIIICRAELRYLNKHIGCPSCVARHIMTFVNI